MIWLEEEGWVVARDDERQPYCTLVGGMGWSFELTGEETAHLVAQVERLRDQVQLCATELMEEETLRCKAVCAWLELEMTGLPQTFELRLRLLSGRGAEGIWPVKHGKVVLEALGRLSDKVAVRVSPVDNE
ncbi:MAG: DUF1818 family protein [Gemmatimonadaceae bacterium]|nr:DUF1818 family protein [Gloeobacterales cyanobacterium ES-bin-141]